jgi:dihydrofolate reductase
MRTISMFMNVTVNGYFEGENHDLSFFKGDDEDDSFFREQSKDGATLMFGRRTYEMMKGFWPTPHAKAAKPEIAEYMNAMPKIVAAHKPFEPGWSKVTVISGDVIAEVRKLKGQEGNGIVILGSNALCVSLLPEGLIDEIQLMVNPVAIGGGTPLFTGLKKRIDFQLTKTREFKSGNALLSYAPKVDD